MYYLMMLSVKTYLNSLIHIIHLEFSKWYTRLLTNKLTLKLMYRANPSKYKITIKINKVSIAHVKYTNLLSEVS